MLAAEEGSPVRKVWLTIGVAVRGFSRETVARVGINLNKVGVFGEKLDKIIQKFAKR